MVGCQEVSSFNGICLRSFDGIYLGKKNDSWRVCSTDDDNRMRQSLGYEQSQ
jgi:hypothetical protein